MVKGVMYLVAIMDWHTHKVLAFLDGPCHRLLEVNIFASVDGIDGLVMMPMVGTSNDHGIDVRTRQELLVIAKASRLFTPDKRLGAVEHLLINVTNGDDFAAGHLC